MIATFTRSGLITIALSLAVYGGVLVHPAQAVGPGARDGWRLLAAVLAGLVLMSRSPQMLMARMSIEGSQDWYGASYDVPQRLTLRPDSFNDIAVTLTNEGRLTWQSTADAAVRAVVSLAERGHRRRRDLRRPANAVRAAGRARRRGDS